MRSETLTVRSTLAALCFVFMAGLFTPAITSANSVEPISDSDAALVAEACLADGERIDRSKQVEDEHVRPGPAEKAEDFELGAAEEAANGNHRGAALGYEQAALHWQKACKLDEAVAALRKAGEHWKKAGEKDKADEAFRKALELERSFK